MRIVCPSIGCCFRQGTSNLAILVSALLWEILVVGGTIYPFYALVIADSIARRLYDIWVFTRCIRCTTGTMWALTGAALAPALTWKN